MQTNPTSNLSTSYTSGTPYPQKKGMSTQQKLLLAGAGAVAAGALYALISQKRQIPKKASAICPFDLKKYMGL